MRASAKDDNVILSPFKPITLKQTIRFIRNDELVEMTPRFVRRRKAVLSVRTRRSGLNT